MNKCYSVSKEEAVSRMWDQNVRVREKDLIQGTDETYTNTILPWIMSHLNTLSKASRILDIGCGCGYLTNLIYSGGYHNIRGIDISPTSIMLAKERYSNIHFIEGDVCKYVSDDPYDLCLAVMTMNNVPD